MREESRAIKRVIKKNNIIPKTKNFWEHSCSISDEKTTTLVIELNDCLKDCSKVTKWHLQQLTLYLNKNIFKAVRVIFSNNKANDNHNEIVLFSDFIAENKTIVLLDLSSNKINPAEMKKLAEGLAKNSVTENLNLSDNSIGGEGLRYLAEELLKIKNCPLKELNLSLNNISGPGILNLKEALKVNKSLTELNLAGNNCNDNGAAILATVLNNCALKKLDLSLNGIGDNKMTYLANALKANKNLIELSLCKNKITDTGIKLLADALVENKMLRCINLSGNKINDDALKYFVKKIKGDRYLTGNYYLTKITLLHEFFFKRKNASLFTELNEIMENNKTFKEKIEKTQEAGKTVALMLTYGSLFDKSDKKVIIPSGFKKNLIRMIARRVPNESNMLSKEQMRKFLPRNSK